MRNLSTILFLTYLVFTFFLKGSDSQACSFSEKQKCDKEYNDKTYSTSGYSFSCRTVEDHLKCVNKVKSACESNLSGIDADQVIKKARATIEHFENLKEKHNCVHVQGNGTGRNITSLFGIALGVLSSYSILKF